MSTSPFAKLSDGTRRLLALSQDSRLGAVEELTHFVTTYPQLSALAAELRPLADRAARVALGWSVLSLAFAVFAAWTYFARLPGWQIAIAVAVAAGALLVSSRSAARQGGIDAAQTALLPLPSNGPMSRETVQSLCREVSPLPAFASATYDKPLYHAHLAWARALARQQRGSRR